MASATVPERHSVTGSPTEPVRAHVPGVFAEGSPAPGAAKWHQPKASDEGARLHTEARSGTLVESHQAEFVAAEFGETSGPELPELLPMPRLMLTPPRFARLGQGGELGAPLSAGNSLAPPPSQVSPPLATLSGGHVNEPSSASPTANSTTSSVVADDRSAWARWNSDLARVTVTLIAFDGVLVGLYSLLPNHVTGWEDPEWKGLKENFTIGPRVDNDWWYWNYLGHPVAGSEYYLLARNRGGTWYESFFYSTAMSTFWEFIVESAYEQAAWQDIWITPVAGTVLGELRYQAKKALENPSTGKPSGTLNSILYVLVDPFDALFQL